MLCFEKPLRLESGGMKMATEKKEKQTKAQIKEQKTAPEDFPAELRLPVWSVISFEKCEASGLTYAQAEQKQSELEAQNVSGLCIVTDEVAARISGKN